MRRHCDEDDAEITGPLCERAAREERIVARVLAVFFVALMAAALVAAKGAAEIHDQWRSAAHVSIDALEGEP